MRKLKGKKGEASKDLLDPKSGAYIVAPVSIIALHPYFPLFLAQNKFTVFFFVLLIIVLIVSYEIILFNRDAVCS